MIAYCTLVIITIRTRNITVTIVVAAWMILSIFPGIFPGIRSCTRV